MLLITHQIRPEFMSRSWRIFKHNNCPTKTNLTYLISNYQTHYDNVLTWANFCAFPVGGSFGSISVEVRSVGGGEPWDNFIKPIAGGFNDTIADALGNRPTGRQAVVGHDYLQLDTVLIFNVSIFFLFIISLKQTFISRDVIHSYIMFFFS